MESMGEASSEVSSSNSIADRLSHVQETVRVAAARCGRDGKDVRLLLATKTVSIDRIAEAARAGHKDFGENKVQEGRLKAQCLADPSLTWSMIGHLQTNKVKDCIKFAGEVQSLDRLTLAEALDRRLQSEGRQLSVLVQVNTSNEESKYGIAADEVRSFLVALRQFQSLRPRGFMTLASFTPDTDEVRRCFRLLHQVRERARNDTGVGFELNALSMGMSFDFEIAVEEGATIVRVGQAVFGNRPFPDSHYWPAK
jgi:PLP dependent protein